MAVCDHATPVPWEARGKRVHAESIGGVAVVGLTGDVEFVALARTAMPAYIRRASTAEHAFRNLIAVIFRDGGHRAEEIGDLTEAARQAEEVVLGKRQGKEAV